MPARIYPSLLSMRDTLPATLWDFEKRDRYRRKQVGVCICVCVGLPRPKVLSDAGIVALTFVDTLVLVESFAFMLFGTLIL